MDSGLSLFSLGVSVCTHTRQVEHQRCRRTGRVQKNHKIRKNTIFNEYPVLNYQSSNVQLPNIISYEWAVNKLPLLLGFKIDVSKL